MTPQVIKYLIHDPRDPLAASLPSIQNNGDGTWTFSTGQVGVHFTMPHDAVDALLIGGTRIELEPPSDVSDRIEEARIAYAKFGRMER